MDFVVIIGIITTLAGLAGLVVCILKARAIRAEKPDAEEVKARVRGLLALNMGSLFVAMFGLILIVMGLIL